MPHVAERRVEAPAPGERPPVDAPCGLLPLVFRRQPKRQPCLGGGPLDVSNGVEPGHPDDRPVGGPSVAVAIDDRGAVRFAIRRPLPIGCARFPQTRFLPRGASPCGFRIGLGHRRKESAVFAHRDGKDTHEEALDEGTSRRALVHGARVSTPAKRSARHVHVLVSDRGVGIERYGFGRSVPRHIPNDLDGIDRIAASRCREREQVGAHLQDLVPERRDAERHGLSGLPDGAVAHDPPGGYAGTARRRLQRKASASLETRDELRTPAGPDTLLQIERRGQVPARFGIEESAEPRLRQHDSGLGALRVLGQGLLTPGQDSVEGARRFALPGGRAALGFMQCGLLVQGAPGFDGLPQRGSLGERLVLQPPRLEVTCPRGTRIREMPRGAFSSMTALEVGHHRGPQGPGAREPCFGLHGQRPHARLLHLCGHGTLRRAFARRARGARQRRHNQRQVGAPLVGWGQGQDLVEDGAQAPHVAPRVQPSDLAARLFG